MSGEKKSPAPASTTLHYDSVLAEIGAFGAWQKRVLVSLWVPVLYCGMAFMTYSFALGMPADYRCRVPACDDGGDADVNSTEAMRFIPVGEDGERSRCQVLPADTCSSVQPNGSEEPYECEEWVYDTSVYTSTVVTEFGLVCDRLHMKSAIGSAGVIIFGLGSSAWGYFSDTYGRKPVILVSLLLGASFNLATSFASSYAAYFALYALAGLCLNGTYIAPFVLTVESVPKDRAALASLLINFPFVAGELILVAVAYFFRDFRHMVRAAFLPTYAFLLVGLFFPESPRWLMANDKTEEAMQIVKKGARINGRELSEERLKELFQKKEEEKVDDKSDGDDGEKVTVWKMFKNKCMRKRLLVMFVNHIAVVLCYNGLTLNAVNLGGSVHLNMALGVAVEVPSYVFCVVTVDRFGRKPVLLLTQFMAAAACAAALAAPAGGWAVVALSTAAKFGTTAAFSVVLLQVLELFPTNVRNTTMGSCSLASRVGGILAPVVTNLGPGHESVPMAVFALTSLAAAAASFLLPETNGRELPATIEEAEDGDDSPSVKDCLKCARIV